MLKWLTHLLASLFKKKPVTPPAPASLDGIDPSLITWDEPAGNVGAWPITATISGARITPDGMQVDLMTGTSEWPLIPGENVKSSIGNWWIIGKVKVTSDDEPTYHAATADWLGRGKTRCTGKQWLAGQDGLHGPLAWWTPQPGDIVGIMVSTPARSGVQTIKERSQIVAVKWP